MKPTSPRSPPLLHRDESETVPFRLDSLIGARVLVLAPHPDDEVFACGGAVRLHVLAGDAVRILVLTDGRHGHGPGAVDIEALVQQRQAETRASAAVLGVNDLEFWSVPDRTLSHDAGAAQRLAGVIDAYRPDLVYCPSPLEHHPDHRAAAWLIWQNASRLPRHARVAFCEVSQPQAVNTLIDISAVAADKRRAARLHVSQLGVLPYLEIIAGLNRYRSLTVSDRATDVEGFFLTPVTNLVGEPMAAFHGWQLRPLVLREHCAEPQVSVVVRTLNRPHLLREALASVAAQPEVETEVVVVNDGGDPVGAVVDEFRGTLRLLLVEHPHTLGRSAAANAGLRACSGRFVNFLDDDDLLLPGHLKKLADFLETTGENVAYSDVVPQACAATCDAIPGPPYAYDFDPQRLRLMNYLPIHAVMFRRSLTAIVGLMDDSLGALEDWDYWIRLSAANLFHRLPGVTACYRSFSHHNHDFRGWYRRIYEKHIAPGERAEQILYLAEHYWELQRNLHRKENEAAALQSEVAALRAELDISQTEAAEQARTMQTMRETIVWRVGSRVSCWLSPSWLRAIRSCLIRLLPRVQ